MSHFRWSLIGIVLIAILAVFAVSAPAYAQAGTGPDDGLDFGVWRALDFNAEQWMCFNYEGDDSNIQLDVFVACGDRHQPHADDTGKIDSTVMARSGDRQ